MVAKLPIVVGTEVDADLLNEISGIDAAASFHRASSASPLTSTANTDASIVTGSFSFVSGYAYEITMSCRYSFGGFTATATAEPRAIFSLTRSNAAGTDIYRSGYSNASDTAAFHFHGSQVVKVTAGDTTQTLSFNAQFSTVAGATSIAISVNGGISPARFTVRRIGLAANFGDALELPTS